MRYLLDANAVIALLNDTTSPIARRIRRYAPRDIEFLRSSSTSPVLEFDQDDARQGGEIRAHLASKATPIGPVRCADRRPGQRHAS
jgi:predicted nucleic acid-binding protein